MKKPKELDPTVVGKNIARLREAKHLSQEQLGNDAGGIAASSICKYEKGSQLPRLDTLYYIANALGCTLDELILGENGTPAITTPQKPMSSEEVAIRHLAALLDHETLYDMVDKNGHSQGCLGVTDKTGTLWNFIQKYKTILNLKNETGDQFEAVKESTIQFYIKEFQDAHENLRNIARGMGAFPFPR